MPLSMIAAIDNSAGLARDGKIPWPRLRQDLKFFRTKTIGDGKTGAVMMGRKTWDSLPKQPLPDRCNVVLSRSNTPLRGAIVVPTIQAALDVTHSFNAFVIGGGEIYRQMLPLVDEVFLTRVLGSYQCDVSFPLDTLTATFRSTLIQRFPADNEEGLPAFYIEQWKRSAP